MFYLIYFLSNFAALSDSACPAAVKEAMALLALPCIVPPGIKKIGKRTIRSSKAEAVKAFVDIGPVRKFIYGNADLPTLVV